MSILAPPPQDELELLIREARERQRKRWLAAAVVGAAAAIVLSVWAAVPGGGNTKQPHSGRFARGGAIAPCSPAQLRISLPRRLAGLGHVNGVLRFTNTSGDRCELSGWPTVVAVEASGKPVPAQRIPLQSAWALSWPQSRPVLPVVLGLGRSSYAEIDGSDIPPGNGSIPCVTARWLRVAASGGGRPVTISALWWTSAGRPVYFALCAGIAVSPFFPRSALWR